MFNTSADSAEIIVNTGQQTSQEMSAKPKQSFEELFSHMTRHYIVSGGWGFYYEDQALTADEVASNERMLPAILWQAEKLHQLLFSKPMGIEFVSDPTCSIGARAQINPAPGSALSMFPLYTLEVIVQALENFPFTDPVNGTVDRSAAENLLLGKKVPPRGATASLDHLVQGFLQDHEIGLLPWAKNSNPRAPLISQPGSPN